MAKAGIERFSVNITRGSGGLSYTADGVPKGEELVASIVYEQKVVRGGSGFFRKKTIILSPIVIEEDAEERGAISLERAARCADEYAERL